LTGLTPYTDIKIEYTGLRPGEKLFEEILTAEEGSMATKHEKIYVANLKKVDEEKLNEGLNALKNIDDADKIVNLLARLVPTYQGSRVRRLRLIEGKLMPEEAL
jgi:FlaA1/EpsC-like NDP-sugar epimerase